MADLKMPELKTLFSDKLLITLLLLISMSLLIEDIRTAVINGRKMFVM
jgi:hypothetical protein